MTTFENTTDAGTGDNSALPLLALDFDDVLNIVLNKPLKENSDYKWRRKSGWAFDSWSSTIYSDDYMKGSFVITTSSEMLDAIKSLEYNSLCEIIWLTTWTQHTGYPKRMITGKQINAAVNSADYTPFVRFDNMTTTDTPESLKAHYDFLSDLVGRQWTAAGGIGLQKPSYLGSVLQDNWWKWDAVVELRAANYPVVFVDDMLDRHSKLYKEDEKADDNLKLVRVNPNMGFTKRDFDTVRTWLQEWHKNKAEKESVL